MLLSLSINPLEVCMKFFFICLTLLLSAITLANSSLLNKDNDQFSTPVKVVKSKCSIGGKLKVKFSGLAQRAGRIGKGYFKSSKLPMKCKYAKSKFRTQANDHSNSLNADVSMNTKVVKRQNWVRDPFPGPGYPYYLDNFSRDQLVCETLEIKKVSLILSEIEIAGKELKLKAESIRVLDSHYGRCR
jgi:hypothetical protein